MSGATPGSGPPLIEGFTDLVKVGQGGFSTVYAATQDGIERRVAIKVLDLGFSDEHRFRRECRTLGSLSGIHGIVPVLQATFSSTGQPCIVMQLMDGGSLSRRVRASGPLSPVDVIRNGGVLCRALQVAHDRRIYHRDIKPENVLFSGNDAAIADFGIALVDDMESRSQTMDSISPPHAPPERFADGHADPVLGDVYSLGSTLYTALAGRPPFGTTADGGLAGLIQRVTAAPVPPIDRVDSPTALAMVLERSMAKNPLDRHQSMASFAAALETAHQAPVVDDLTVRRAASSPRPTGAAPLAAAPLIGHHLAQPPNTEPTPSSPVNPTIHRLAASPPPISTVNGSLAQAGDRRRHRRVVAAAWSVATILLVASLVGGAYFVGGRTGQENSTGPAIADPTTTTTVEPTTTSVVTSTTTSTTTTPTTLPPSAPPPAAATARATTTSPPPLPVSEATTAVDQYLAAASGFDVDAFAARWSYPIEIQYTRSGVNEGELRDSAVRYFDSKSDLQFGRTGPTAVAASPRGWETTTEYQAEQWPIDGDYRCEIASIRLGFDASWRLRTATESKLRDCP